MSWGDGCEERWDTRTAGAAPIHAQMAATVHPGEDQNSLICTRINGVKQSNNILVLLWKQFYELTLNGPEIPMDPYIFENSLSIHFLGAEWKETYFPEKIYPSLQTFGIVLTTFIIDN